MNRIEVSYNTHAPSTSPSLQPSEKQLIPVTNDDESTTSENILLMIIVEVVSVVIGLVIVATLFSWCRKRRISPSTVNPYSLNEDNDNKSKSDNHSEGNSAIGCSEFCNFDT
jgi:hypothetical protein